MPSLSNPEIFTLLLCNVHLRMPLRILRCNCLRVKLLVGFLLMIKGWQPHHGRFQTFSPSSSVQMSVCFLRDIHYKWISLSFSKYCRSLIKLCHQGAIINHWFHLCISPLSRYSFLLMQYLYKILYPSPYFVFIVWLYCIYLANCCGFNTR